MTQEVAKPRTFRDDFEKMTPEVRAALPPQIPVERFMRVVLTAVNGNPDLLAADRRSLFESAMKAAQDGLLPDGRDGAFVVYNTKAKDANGRDSWIKKVQWLPMIAGILKKVRNSGDILSLSAHIAYEKDEFHYVLGDDERIEHRPAMGERGAPVLAYAIAKTKDGGIYREVMTVSDIEKVRSVSRAKNSGPWVDWWDEMARKTVLRRLAKRLPMSTDLDDLIRRDDELYDFKSGRDAAIADAGRVFTPIAAPFADAPPPKLAAIDHDADTGEVADEAPPPKADAPAPPPPPPEPPTDPVEVAYDQGVAARKRGVSIKSIPADLKAPGREVEADAWREGWETADKAERGEG